MRPRAGPKVVFGPRDHPGAHRIQLDIADRMPEVGFIEHRGKISPLPDVTRPILAIVQALRIPSMQLTENSPQRVGTSRYDHQMYVIRHEAIGKNLHAVRITVLTQPFQVGAMVRFREENLSAPIAALGDVVRCARAHEASSARHGRRLQNWLRSAVRFSN